MAVSGSNTLVCIMTIYTDDALREVLEGSPIGVAILEVATARRMFVNSALVGLFGAASQDEMLTRTIAETWVDSYDLKHAFKVFAGGDQLVNYEAERRRFDGSRWWVLMNTQPIVYEGVQAGIVWHIDITRRKEAERLTAQARLEAERANRAKSDLLANTSHELRTPLNAIVGFSQFLLNETISPNRSVRDRDYIASIYRAGTHLTEIISDILDVSKIEANALELDEETFDPAGLIAEAANILAPRVAEASLTLDAEPAPDLPDLRADRLRAKQILINLLGNAVKFTRAGGRVTLGARIAPSGGIEMWVADTGIGIAAADLDAVLQPFGQVASAMTRNHHGNGLGLSICKSLIELHGGRLTLASEVGAGTTATIVFPPDRTATS
ncbi:MAG: ATP-binding protein [Rhodospirillaceae bacterium]